MSAVAPIVALLAQLAAPGPPEAERELHQLLASAGAALESGDLTNAESGFQRAAALAPGSPLPPLGLCEVEARRERLLPALAHCRESQRLAPEAPLPALRVAQLLAQAGSTDEALKAFARARQLDPSEPQAWGLPALLRRDRGELEAAQRLLEQGLDQAPAPELAEELGLVLLAQGEVARARRVAEQSLERWPDSAGLPLVLGLSLSGAESRGDRERAAALLLEALARGAPNPGRVRLELGRLLLELERAPEAVEQLRAAVRRLPEEAEAHYRLGQALQSSGDAAGARASLERFQQLSRARDDGEWIARGVSAALKDAQQRALDGQLGDALERVNAVLAAHPRVHQALALRARLLASQGRESEALPDAQAARSAAPEVADYHYLEGLFLVRSGELEAGRAALGRALALDDALPQAWDLLAAVSRASGRREDEVEQLRAALAAGSEDSAGLRLRLAEALEALGRADEARAERQAAAGSQRP